MSLVAAHGDAALQAVLISSIVVPLALLGVVCWIFWKASKRDER